MKVTINETELTAIECYAYERVNGKRELVIVLPQTEIAHDDLKALIKVNTGDIVLTKEDGKKENFVGYKTTCKITDMVHKELKVEVYEVVIDCVGEAERIASEAQAEVAELNATIEAQNETIEQQTAEIEMLNDTLLAVIMG